VKVDHHISELLFDHDCVIVPAFGGFLASYNHARIHSAQHTFYPPSKRIAFNIFLKQNDGLLANRISGHDHIPYHEALRQLEQQVAYWQKELEAGNKLVIEKVGTFYLNSEKNLQFDPVKNINYLRDAFGLSTVQYLPVKRENSRERVEKEFKKIGTSRASEKQNKPPIQFSKRNRKKLLTTLIISGTLLWFSANLYLISPHRPGLSSLNPFESKGKTEIPKKEKTPGYIAPLAATKVETMPASPDPMAEASVKNNIKETVAEIPSKPSVSIEDQKYFVIGGAFEISENAEAFVKTLQAEGFTAARILNPSGRLKKVSYNGFSARAEAARELDSLKTLNKSGWIFVR
jgi:cell division protein FtsN